MDLKTKWQEEKVQKRLEKAIKKAKREAHSCNMTEVWAVLIDNDIRFDVRGYTSINNYDRPYGNDFQVAGRYGYKQKPIVKHEEWQNAEMSMWMFADLLEARSR
jgi:hypothetical protein